jgi:hypothetical protein
MHSAGLHLLMLEDPPQAMRQGGEVLVDDGENDAGVYRSPSQASLMFIRRPSRPGAGSITALSRGGFKDHEFSCK